MFLPGGRDIIGGVFEGLFMKIALNGATTMHADLETDIKAASEAGFELIEIWAAKLREFLKTKTAEDLKTLLDEHNLEPYSINSIERITFRTSEDYAEIKAECEELSSVAGKIGAPYVVVVPGKLPENSTKEQIIEESTKVLNELGDIAEKHGVSLAFEFLGQTDCSVQTLDLCNEIVENVNRENIGNVLDTFHFDANFENVEKVKRQELFFEEAAELSEDPAKKNPLRAINLQYFKSYIIFW